MSLGMKNNIESINAINHLTEAQKEMTDSLKRLASGQKINNGADSPDGLIMSEVLRAQIAGVQQAIQNTEFSLSLVQTAEGALVEVNNLLLKRLLGKVCGKFTFTLENIFRKLYFIFREIFLGKLHCDGMS